MSNVKNSMKWGIFRLYEISCKTVKFDILRALRTVQVSGIDAVWVVTPLNSGQSISFFSPLDQKEALRWTVGSFADCLSGLQLLPWERMWQEGRREETEDVYEILKRPNLPPHSPPHKYHLPPSWDTGPVHSSQSCRTVSEAGSPWWQHLQMHQALRNSASTRCDCCFIKSWTEIDQEHYKEKRSVNLPTAIHQFSWISFFYLQ